MSLYITFKETKPILCPHCGQKVQDEIISQECSWGKEWYQPLESIGCYVPEEWCGREVTLTREQIDTIYWHINKQYRIHNRYEIIGLIARAIMLKHQVVVNVGC